MRNATQILPKSLLIVGFVLCNTSPRWVEGINGDTFCKWDALSYLLLAVSATIPATNKIILCLYQWAAILAFNNAYDEILGDPRHVNMVEISVSVIVTTWTTLRLRCLSKMN